MTSVAKCHVILGYLDSPLKILYWTKGEILMVLGPFFVSVFLDAFLFGITASFLNVMVIKNYKKRFGKGQLQAVLYWYLPPTPRLAGLPLSYIREFLG